MKSDNFMPTALEADQISLDTLRCGSSLSINTATYVPQMVQIGVRCPETHFESIFTMKVTESVGDLRTRAALRTSLTASEAINYGLFLPAQGSKKGKFLADERPIADYPALYRTKKNTPVDNTQSNSPDSGLGQEICWLELIYKARLDAEEAIPTSRLRRLKARMSRGHFIDLVRDGDINTIEKWLKRGFDPNFQSKKDGETPLTVAATMFNPRELIITLVNGGAHLDFRATDSYTPLHRAAVSGNYEAIRTLLDLGQNPNCRDSSGLTPLYHAVSTDVSSRCTQTLLYDHAILGVEDNQGFQEIHQACKKNRAHHLENLIMYGADLNARTKKGNTPLHICVMNEADLCLHLLLVRGADPTLTNEQGQTPLEYCVLTNRNALVQIFNDFKPEDVVPITDTPAYNMDRRPTINGPRAAAICYSRAHGSTAESIASSSLRGSPLSMLDRMSIASTDSFAPYNASTSTYASLSSNLTPTPNAVRSISLQPQMQTSFGGTKVTYGGPSNETSSGRGDCAFPMERRYTPQPGGQTTYTETSPDGHFLRTVVLQKGRDGFGFTLNGVPKVALCRNGLHRKGFPGNHFFPTILPGGPAAKAGIKPGDYVIEINGQSVIDACHEDAVQWIHDAGDTLAMRVVTLNNRRADPYEENTESDASSSRSSTLPRSLNGSSSSSTIYDKRSRSHVRLDDRSSRRRGRSMQPTTSDREKVWTSRPSPATQSKERVFIIQDIDGKKKAVPTDDNSNSFKTTNFANRTSRTAAADCESDSDDTSNTFTGHGSTSEESEQSFAKRNYPSRGKVRPHRRNSSQTSSLPRSASFSAPHKAFFQDGHELCIYDPNYPTEHVAKAPKMIPLIPRKSFSTVDRPNLSTLNHMMHQNGGRV